MVAVSVEESNQECAFKNQATWTLIKVQLPIFQDFFLALHACYPLFALRDDAMFSFLRAVFIEIRFS